MLLSVIIISSIYWLYLNFVSLDRPICLMSQVRLCLCATMKLKPLFMVFLGRLNLNVLFALFQQWLQWKLLPHDICLQVLKQQLDAHSSTFFFSVLRLVFCRSFGMNCKLLLEVVYFFNKVTFLFNFLNYLLLRRFIKVFYAFQGGLALLILGG